MLGNTICLMLRLTLNDLLLCSLVALHSVTFPLYWFLLFVVFLLPSLKYSFLSCLCSGMWESEGKGAVEGESTNIATKRLSTKLNRFTVESELPPIFRGDNLTSYIWLHLAKLVTAALHYNIPIEWRLIQ